MMTPFDYNYQNPSGFPSHMLIRAIVIFTPLGIHNLSKKRKNKLDCGNCSQMTLSCKLPIRSCLHGGRKILEGVTTFRLVYMQKFLSRWKWRMKARWRARTTNM